MRHLPPLSQLRAFEAAARHRSFKLAAAELSVTPAAISHQIRELEARLGMPLFERLTRQVVPTVDARALYPVLRDGFDAFADAIAGLMPTADPGAVVLATTPAFAMQWLLPRLPDLQRRHPGIALRIHASHDPVDLARAEADLAVRYGEGPYPGHDALVLAVDRFLPVASPRLDLRLPADLQRHRLVHFDWHRSAADRPTWPAWLHGANLRHDDAQRGLRFSEESHAIQAAIAGQGIALLGCTLVQGELERGVLVSPFGPALPAASWHLLHHSAAHWTDATRTLWRWLAAGFDVTRDPAADDPVGSAP